MPPCAPYVLGEDLNCSESTWRRPIPHSPEDVCRAECRGAWLSRQERYHGGAFRIIVSNYRDIKAGKTAAVQVTDAAI
jgi:hypothetical protein